ncbi:mitochondrial ribosomal protein [Mollisia scopiformis]|uniref:Small ribosomal subunit protein mS29 n=1 Tax=Mollisia scopiformis TaxID=149040 RepID=A0A194XR86_MOLSC|nr:mitochondrial ribosomal protein [Mollisia scopiformis]KUJ22703.1 mitochondrial ribosomal protein [Mollisia scopiformis]
MASSNCWRCLSRPANASLLPLSRPSFSTTAFVAAAPKASTKAPARAKGEKTLRIKKKAFVKTGKPPAPGERKAMRKRIVLSNTNALEVAGMKDLDAEMVDSMVRGEDAVLDGALQSKGETHEDVVGKVVGLKGETVDSLRAVEAFKTTQGWGLFRRPGLLIREESVELCRRMTDAAANKKALRLVIDGEKGSGKSLMLLQAMATAFVKEWVVLNIPEAQELTNAVNDYTPVDGTKPTLWSQNTYTANWLGQIGKANNAVLQNTTMRKEYKLPIPVQSNISLARLCELGARDPDVAWPIFQAFWSEITNPGRRPVLICLDSLSNIMQTSSYRAPDYSLIHSHDLAIVRHFVNLLSRPTSGLPNGGAIIAATSRSHAPISKSMELAIKQSEEKAAQLRGWPGKVTQRDPFEKSYDERADKALQNVEVMRLKGLSKVEARGLMEYWAQSGVLRSRVDEETVAQKWALAGNGIVGEIQRGALWMRI